MFVSLDDIIILKSLECWNLQNYTNKDIDIINEFPFEPEKLGLMLSSLSIYRNLLETKVFICLKNLIDYFRRYSNKDIHISKDVPMDKSMSIDLGEFIELYNNLYFELTKYGDYCTLKQYIINQLILDENIFVKQAGVRPYAEIEPHIKSAATNDLFCLESISDLSSSMLKKYVKNSMASIETQKEESFENSLIDNLPQWDKEPLSNVFDYKHGYSKIIGVFKSSKNWGGLIELLADFHNKWGYGDFAKFRAFVWYNDKNSGYLKGIENPDSIRLTDLIGYESQRQEVLDNTMFFLRGYPANNILLYGDRGTGKSSTIKAIVNEYYHEGLRIIEIPKKHLMHFPEVISFLAGRKQKFIIFVDDLAFEDNEENYTALKAILEGGVESKPSNILIYATSNRRHLIKEKFSDRAGLSSSDPDEEIHAADTIQEKLSLADRFGIKVTFSTPNKNEFLEIVEGITKLRGISVDKTYLHREALKWELFNNGRSPRTAKQFVDWLEAKSYMQDLDQT